MATVKQDYYFTVENNPMAIAWINFIDSLKILLVPIPNDRGMDQYLQFRDEVLNYVGSQKFIEELDSYWSSNLNEDFTSFKLLLMELQAFPRALEAANAEAEAATTETETRKEKKKGWRSRWFGRASTVAGSAKDILGNLPGYMKNGLTILKELFDLFKGK